MNHKTGDIIAGRYQIMALNNMDQDWEVYRAFDQATSLIYDLKVCSPEITELRMLAKRLEHAARTSISLTHANIVPVYDVVRDSNGAVCLVTDCVPGQSLRDFLKDNSSQTADVAIPLFIQIAEALEYAHQKAIVHGFLMPRNIGINQSSAGPIAKVMNFAVDEIASYSLVTRTMTPAHSVQLADMAVYISPEQCEGEAVTERSDIYSFGCIMYESLAGEPPFKSKCPTYTAFRHVSEPPRALLARDQMGNDLISVIERCLQKRPAARYLGVTALLRDLERILDGRSPKTMATGPLFRTSYERLKACIGA